MLTLFTYYVIFALLVFLAHMIYRIIPLMAENEEVQNIQHPTISAIFLTFFSMVFVFPIYLVTAPFVLLTFFI